jgi:hypothetical protein
MSFQNVIMKQEFKQYIKTLRCFSNSLPQDCKSSGVGTWFSLHKFGLGKFPGFKAQHEVIPMIMQSNHETWAMTSSIHKQNINSYFSGQLDAYRLQYPRWFGLYGSKGYSKSNPVFSSPEQYIQQYGGTYTPK